LHAFNGYGYYDTVLTPIFKETSDCIAQITPGSRLETMKLRPAVEMMDGFGLQTFLVSQLGESHEHGNSGPKCGLNLFLEEEFVIDAWRPGSR
jgi:hypothetical protein